MISRGSFARRFTNCLPFGVPASHTLTRGCRTRCQRTSSSPGSTWCKWKPCRQRSCQRSMSARGAARAAAAGVSGRVVRGTTRRQEAARGRPVAGLHAVQARAGRGRAHPARARALRVGELARAAHVALVAADLIAERAHRAAGRGWAAHGLSARTERAFGTQCGSPAERPQQAHGLALTRLQSWWSPRR